MLDAQMLLNPQNVGLINRKRVRSANGPQQWRKPSREDQKS
jgi:hypothetical protein